MARRTALDMTLAEVFPALIAKAERKGRTRLDKLIDEFAKGKPLEKILNR